MATVRSKNGTVLSADYVRKFLASHSDWAVVGGVLKERATSSKTPSAFYWSKYFYAHPDEVMGKGGKPVKRTNPFPAGYWEKYFTNHSDQQMGPDGKPQARTANGYPPAPTPAPETTPAPAPAPTPEVPSVPAPDFVGPGTPLAPQPNITDPRVTDPSQPDATLPVAYVPDAPIPKLAPMPETTQPLTPTPAQTEAAKPVNALPSPEMSTPAAGFLDPAPYVRSPFERAAPPQTPTYQAPPALSTAPPAPDYNAGNLQQNTMDPYEEARRGTQLQYDTRWRGLTDYQKGQQALADLAAQYSGGQAKTLMADQGLLSSTSAGKVSADLTTRATQPYLNQVSSAQTELDNLARDLAEKGELTLQSLLRESRAEGRTDRDAVNVYNQWQYGAQTDASRYTDTMGRADTGAENEWNWQKLAADTGQQQYSDTLGQQSDVTAEQNLRWRTETNQGLRAYKDALDRGDQQLAAQILSMLMSQGIAKGSVTQEPADFAQPNMPEILQPFAPEPIVKSEGGAVLSADYVKKFIAAHPGAKVVNGVLKSSTGDPPVGDPAEDTFNARLAAARQPQANVWQNPAWANYFRMTAQAPSPMRIQPYVPPQAPIQPKRVPYAPPAQKPLSRVVPMRAQPMPPTYAPPQPAWRNPAFSFWEKLQNKPTGDPPVGDPVSLNSYMSPMFKPGTKSVWQKEASESARRFGVGLEEAQRERDLRTELQNMADEAAMERARFDVNNPPAQPTSDPWTQVNEILTSDPYADPNGGIYNPEKVLNNIVSTTSLDIRRLANAGDVRAIAVLRRLGLSASTSTSTSTGGMVQPEASPVTPTWRDLFSEGTARRLNEPIQNIPKTISDLLRRLQKGYRSSVGLR